MTTAEDKDVVQELHRPPILPFFIGWTIFRSIAACCLTIPRTPKIIRGENWCLGFCRQCGFIGNLRFSSQLARYTEGLRGTAVIFSPFQSICRNSGNRLDRTSRSSQQNRSGGWLW